MRQNNDWFFTKYDLRGRAIITGVYKESNQARQSLQGMQQHLRSQNVYWEQREQQSGTTFDAQHGYTNDRVFPTGGAESGVIYWSITYYDDYDFNNDGTADEIFVDYPESISGSNLVDFEQDVFRTDGQVTGSKTRILNQQQIFESNTGEYGAGHPTEASEVYYLSTDNSGYQITLKPGFKTLPGQKVHIGSTDDVAVPAEIMDAHDYGSWLEGTTFYDKYGNSIYTKSTNHVGGEDQSWTLYTFDGLVYETLIKHSSTSENLTLKNRYYYDTQGRLTHNWHYINGAQQRVSKHNYNELGQLRTKHLNEGTNYYGYPSYSQTLDYTYDEQGRLLMVNYPDNLYQSINSNMDVFAYRLSYNTLAQSETNTVLYNGNITNMEWRDATGRHCYDYEYDPLSQLIGANYVEECDAQTENQSATPNAYGANYTYDVNGNIQTLERRSLGNVIDNLQYEYQGIGNRLTTIDDAIAGNEGFRDDALANGTEYTYDINGNMEYDANKGILSITYNYMNLPEVIRFEGGNKIIYTYDAAGTKIQQQTFPAGASPRVTTTYSAGFVYENNTLEYFPFSEGTVRKVNGNWRREYNLTDHLGNVRSTFFGYYYNSPSVLQRDSYYPFGMKMPGLSYIASGADENKFTYNGKELEDEFDLDWYHYGWRFYDATVARWWAVDPMDEFHSPYMYVGNSPIMLVDPDGMKSYNPIYSSITGKFLGTDSKGWEGEPIFMNDKLFYQDMDHDLAASLGTFMSNFNWTKSKFMKPFFGILNERNMESLWAWTLNRLQIQLDIILRIFKGKEQLSLMGLLK